MEISTEENEKLVKSICDGVSTADKNNTPVHESHRLIEEIDNFSMEVNSGASFEQYFRWARLEQIARIVNQLEAVGLTEAAEITSEAISVAYPDGLPPIPDDKVSLASWDGSEEQYDRLRELADRLIEYNGTMINKLADYARHIGV
jgi:Domain of unknown function (DUF4375)